MARVFIMQTSDEVKEMLKEFKVLEPPRLRQTWTNSRLIAYEDGSTMPVLHVIAEKVFGAWDPNTHYPCWKDRDWTNESLDNVQLIRKAEHRARRTSPYGPSGTPEYYKAYRKANPGRVKEWATKAQGRYQDSRRELAIAKELVKRTEEENNRLRARLGEGEVSASQPYENADGVRTPASASPSSAVPVHEQPGYESKMHAHLLEILENIDGKTSGTE